MIRQFYLTLSPYWQKMVDRECKAKGISLDDFPMADFEKLKKGTERVASLLGRNVEELKVDDVSRKNDELKTKLRLFMQSVPERYRAAELEKDFSAPFISRLRDGQSGVVVGGNGIGKTRLAWALAIFWKQQDPSCTVQIVKGAELLSEVKATEGDWYRYIREGYGQSAHLFIDEIDKIKGSEADWMLLTYLIDYRYEWMRQTVVLGNCGKDEAMRLLGQSSYSRLSGDGAEAYHLVGTDKRKGKESQTA